MIRGVATVFIVLCALLSTGAIEAKTTIIQGPVRHAAGGAADYVVTKGQVYVDAKPSATEIKICLYTAAGALITNGCSDSGITIGTVPGWHQVTWTTSPAALTSTTRYQIRTVANGYWEPADDAGARRNYITTTGTYAAPVATVVAVPGTIDGGDQNVGLYSVYVQNASSQTIIGTTSVGGTLTNQFNPNDMIGYTQGYVCCAF